ncbi:MAG TPA: polyphosphate kinase 1, partial [Gemmatimonadaceae bacterium]
DVLYPEGTVESAHCFRLTRGGDLDLSDSGVRDLLPAVEEAAHRRAVNPIVRIEVERGMPPLLRELLLAELGNERGSDGAPLTPSDVYEVDWPLDLRALGAIADLARPELRFAPFRARAPIDEARSIFDALRDGDVLAHHPWDSFEGTAGRLVSEAAEDPAVVAIKVTLYRVDNPSPVVEAMLRAAQAGKEVVAYVELRARFDESRNVAWVRRLERAGARLVYGKVGLKTHAKVMLVVRREEGRMRRYVHAGSGNYNSATSRLYTDISLLSADPTLGADISDFFNELTGTPGAPQAVPRSCLVGPRHLLGPLLERVRREAAHAREGRGGRIRVKVNGLSDPEMIRALYDASRAGVEIDLVVRGICTLRPGVPGLSDRIRVVSVLGRFLEHSRIYHFGNGGADEYFIGSADLRPRNLRRRIEMLVPILDARRRTELDDLLSLYLTDPGAWELRPHGAYDRRTSADGVAGTQERLLAGLEPPTDASVEGAGEAPARGALGPVADLS